MLIRLLFALLSLPGRVRRWWSPPPVPAAVVRLRARVVAELLAVDHIDAALRVGSVADLAPGERDRLRATLERDRDERQRAAAIELAARARAS